MTRTSTVELVHQHGLDALSDLALVRHVAGQVARPRTESDSFILHAPLEVLARATLLQRCSPSVRDAARLRLVWVGRTYESHPAAPETAPPSPDLGPDALAARTLDAVAAGEPDDAAAWAGALARAVPADRLASLLGDAVVGSLAAAGHAPIFFSLLPRVAWRDEVAASMLAPLVRHLAQQPTWRLDWIDRLDEPWTEDGAADVGAAAAATPVLGVPGSAFIHPLMRQAEDSGLAAAHVGPHLGTDLAAATTALLRVSTASMVRDDPDHAPYGWSHCLTMPQAAAALAPVLRDPRRAVAVAGTYVVGFRAALGRAPLDTLPEVAPDAGAPLDLGAGHDAAVRAFLAAPAEARTALVQRVVDMAAVHPDAHLAKYVVACLDAARTDPQGAVGHLAAAVHLAAWWQALGPDPDDDLAGAWTSLPTGV